MDFVKSVKLAGGIDFDTSMTIRYGGICEINTKRRNLKFDILIQISIAEKILKFKET